MMVDPTGQPQPPASLPDTARAQDSFKIIQGQGIKGLVFKVIAKGDFKVGAGWAAKHIARVHAFAKQAPVFLRSKGEDPDLVVSDSEALQRFGKSIPDEQQMQVRQLFEQVFPQEPSEADPITRHDDTALATAKAKLVAADKKQLDKLMPKQKSWDMQALKKSGLAPVLERMIALQDDWSADALQKSGIKEPLRQIGHLFSKDQRREDVVLETIPHPIFRQAITSWAESTRSSALPTFRLQDRIDRELEPNDPYMIISNAKRGFSQLARDGIITQDELSRINSRLDAIALTASLDQIPTKDALAQKIHDIRKPYLDKLPNNQKISTAFVQFQLGCLSKEVSIDESTVDLAEEPAKGGRTVRARIASLFENPGVDELLINMFSGLRLGVPNVHIFSARNRTTVNDPSTAETRTSGVFSNFVPTVKSWMAAIRRRSEPESRGAILGAIEKMVQEETVIGPDGKVSAEYCKLAVKMAELHRKDYPDPFFQKKQLNLTGLKKALEPVKEELQSSEWYINPEGKIRDPELWSVLKSFAATVGKADNFQAVEDFSVLAERGRNGDWSGAIAKLEQLHASVQDDSNLVTDELLTGAFSDLHQGQIAATAQDVLQIQGVSKSWLQPLKGLLSKQDPFWNTKSDLIEELNALLDKKELRSSDPGNLVKNISEFIASTTEQELADELLANIFIALGYTISNSQGVITSDTVGGNIKDLFAEEPASLED